MSDNRIIVMRGTGPQWNPGWFTRKRCRDIDARNATAYRCDVMGDFAEPEASLFGATALKAATRTNLELPSGCSFFAAMDSATRGNSWTLVILARLPTVPPTFAVVGACEWTGSKSDPLDPEVIVQEVADIVQPFGIRTIISDQWLIDSIISYARKHGLQVEKRDPSMAEKVALYETLRLEIEAGRFELPDVQQLRDDLLHVKKKVTQAGLSIELPRTADGRHCDFCPATMLSFKAALTGYDPGFWRGMAEANDSLPCATRWGHYDQFYGTKGGFG